MQCPFPDMEPYLEHPSLWPDAHNSLITAMRDALVSRMTPCYYLALERRTCRLAPDDIVVVGRPDISISLYHDARFDLQLDYTQPMFHTAFSAV